MYVRDKNFDGDETDFFTMAEYCQVFLTAHFIKEDKEDHIPLIERGRVGRMSKEIGDIVCKEMDEIFNIAVSELEKFGYAPEQFFKKMESSEYDPISDFIDTDEMRNALGNVIMRRLRITAGIRGDEAFDEAKRRLGEVRDSLHTFVSALIMHAMERLVKNSGKRGIPLSQLSTVVKPKIEAIGEGGLHFSSNFDMSKVEKIQETEKKKEKEKVRYDPAWG